VNLTSAASRWRSESMQASRGNRSARRSSVGSENAAPAKLMVPTMPACVLGDATNTYSSGLRPPVAPDVHLPTKPSAFSQRFSRDIAEDMDELVPPEDAQQVGVYEQDIFEGLRREELRHLISPNYMERQVHVNAKMRAILIDWLVDVHKKYKLRPETLFLTVQLIDRYLEVQVTKQSHLQLVGATALLIAAKFEEIHPPAIKEFEYITDKAYSRDEILKMEIIILKALQFKICAPTAVLFLEKFQSVNGCSESHCSLSQYLLELSLGEYKMLKYAPSHLAASAILLSNKLLRKPSWTAASTKQTKMSEPMLKDCAKEMCALLELAEGSSLQATRRKFSQSKHHSVAQLNFMASAVGHMPAATTGSIGRIGRSSTSGAMCL